MARRLPLQALMRCALVGDFGSQGSQGSQDGGTQDPPSGAARTARGEMDLQGLFW